MTPNHTAMNAFEATTYNLTRNSRRLVLGAIASAVLISGCATNTAPTEQLAVSRAAVSNATNSDATEFASAEMKSAQEGLDAANKAMAAKDYEAALALAEQAQADAQLATIKARTAKAQKAVPAEDEGTRVLHDEMQRNAKKLTDSSYQGTDHEYSSHSFFHAHRQHPAGGLQHRTSERPPGRSPQPGSNRGRQCACNQPCARGAEAGQGSAGHRGAGMDQARKIGAGRSVGLFGETARDDRRGNGEAESGRASDRDGQCGSRQSAPRCAHLGSGQGSTERKSFTSRIGGGAAPIGRCTPPVASHARPGRAAIGRSEATDGRRTTKIACRSGDSVSRSAKGPGVARHWRGCPPPVHRRN